ncbi:MAG: ferric reductase-like transmembrane domain-containing protein, partial [Coriobacteriia bacterium]|nr:ferric reductase-like transmembrane domain-containing protein [Coriobacteriia bacterium]
MRFLAGLLTAFIFTAVFRVPIRKAPYVFYLLMVLCDVLLLTRVYESLPIWLYTYFLSLFQSNTLGIGFFTIVMFVGVFKERSTPRKLLVPIRAELSIMASILTVGHVVRYGLFYLEQIFSADALMPAFRFWGTILAFVALLPMIPLAITSIKRIRARMSNRNWQRLQRLSYPFFGLVFVHILFFLLAPALSGNSSAIISVCAYLVIG